MKICKHVFAILHYTEHKATLGHNKTCTSKKQKWGIQVFRKSKKVHPPTKIGNVSFVKLHHKYEYTKLQDAYQEKKSRLDPQSPRF